MRSSFRATLHDRRVADRCRTTDGLTDRPTLIHCTGPNWPAFPTDRYRNTKIAPAQSRRQVALESLPIKSAVCQSCVRCSSVLLNVGLPVPHRPVSQTRIYCILPSFLWIVSPLRASDAPLFPAGKLALCHDIEQKDGSEHGTSVNRGTENPFHF